MGSLAGVHTINLLSVNSVGVLAGQRRNCPPRMCKLSDTPLQCANLRGTAEGGRSGPGLPAGCMSRTRHAVRRIPRTSPAALPDPPTVTALSL